MYKSVAISYESERDLGVAQSLAAQLGLPLTTDKVPKPELVLYVVGEKLVLRSQSLFAGQDFELEFLSPATKARLKKINKHDILFRALHLRKLEKKLGRVVNCLDVTAGWGMDSLIARCLGANVLLCEINPIVFALLQAATRQARRHSSLFAKDHNCAVWQLYYGNAINYLQDCLAGNKASLQPVDIIMIDPMFLRQKRHAKAKKSMQWLQYLAGDLIDYQQLFDLSCKVAEQRVVVKRARHAPTITARRPSFQVFDKTVRMDVYVSNCGDKNK